MLYSLIAIVLAGIIGIYLLYRFEDSYSFFPTVAGFLLCLASGVLSLGYCVMIWMWFASFHQVKIINQEFGTHYTQEEIFWASDVIDEIRELKRNRVEINGNVMGHGDPGEGE